MRIMEKERQIIKEVSREVFGPGVKVLLFGSRTDDSRSGGDIDLYVQGVRGSVDERVQARILFLCRVKAAIGEQRIDVVLAPQKGEEVLPIHKIAEQTGVAL